MAHSREIASSVSLRTKDLVTVNEADNNGYPEEIEDYHCESHSLELLSAQFPCVVCIQKLQNCHDDES